jgi:predicted nucleotidyltransferase
MDKKDVLEIIHDFKNALQLEKINPQQIILFGSYASGNARPDSDIDLVVISDDFEGKDYWQRIDIIASAIYRVFKPIEAIAMTTEEWLRGDSMITDYARNGQVVVEAVP